MEKIEFSKQERAEIVLRIQAYFDAEMDQPIGAIPAEMLLNFFTDQIGGFYYNRGLGDAQAVLMKKLDEVSDAIYGLEQREAGLR